MLVVRGRLLLSLRSEDTLTLRHLLVVVEDAIRLVHALLGEDVTALKVCSVVVVREDV